MADLIKWVGLPFRGTRRVHDLLYCFWCIQPTNALSQEHNAIPSPISWFSMLSDSAVHRFPFLLTPPHPRWKEAASTHQVAVSWDKIMAESVRQDLYPEVCNTSNPQNLQAEHHHFLISCILPILGEGRRACAQVFSHIVRKNWGFNPPAKDLAFRQC